MASDAAGWPTDAIVQRWEALSDGSRPSEVAVLLTTGAINPVHLGHIDMMERARRWHFRRGAGPKCRSLHTGCETSGARLDLCRAAVQNIDWLEVGSWEADPAHPRARMDRWPDFPDVAVSLRRRLDQVLPTTEAVVLYVCGLDHFEKCGLRHGMGIERVGVVAVGRSGNLPPASSLGSSLVFGCQETNPAVENISSTAVREAMREGRPVDGLVGPAVAALLSARKLYGV